MSVANIPGYQKIWGWKITIFLFLAGAAAGAYLMGFILAAVYSQTVLIKVAIPASAIFAAIGIIAMLWHARQKSNFILVFSRPGTSWMSRGAIALAVFFILTLVDMGLWRSGGTYSFSSPHMTVGILASVTALLILIFTGMLLKTLKPIAFWNSKLVPVLFLVSGLTTGVMGLALSLGIAGFSTTFESETISLLASSLVVLIIIEALFLILYLWTVNRSDSRISVNAVIKGSLSVYFWVGVVVFGLVIPFVIVIVLASTIGMFITGVAGFVGGLALKYVIISGGAGVMLDVRGVLVALPVSTRMTVSQYMSKIGAQK